jgi:hypothetical protein
VRVKSAASLVRAKSAASLIRAKSAASLIRYKSWASRSLKALATGYTVSGAGRSAENGHYSVYGTNDGVTSYKQDTATHYLYRYTGDHKWYIGTAVNNTDTYDYKSTNANAATPDTATAGAYVDVSAFPPPPTVTGPN